MQTGECEGSLIANGTIIQVDDSGFASFGLTSDGQWAFGDVTSEVVSSAGVVELLSGFKGGLLVDNRQPVPSTSTLVAQRTAVGIDDAGQAARGNSWPFQPLELGSVTTCFLAGDEGVAGHGFYIAGPNLEN